MNKRNRVNFSSENKFECARKNFQSNLAHSYSYLLDSNLKVSNSFVTSQGESSTSCCVILLSIRENEKWEQNLTLQLAVLVTPQLILRIGSLEVRKAS